MRARGITVEVQASVLILLLIYSGQLASTRFLGRYPGLSDLTITVMTIATVLLAIASIVPHEFGHALRARREGLGVDRITLWGLGGVAWIEPPRSPGAAFRMTAAGPLVSAALAALLGALGLLGRQIGLPDAVVGVAILLAEFNAAIFVFNLVPVFPLDGGRILHSFLWRLRGPAIAWVWSIRVGVAVASSVLAVGAVGPLLGLLPATYGPRVLITGVLLLWWSTRNRGEPRQHRAARRSLVVDDMVRLDTDGSGPNPGLGTTIADFLEQNPRGKGYGTSAVAVLDGQRAIGSISPGLALQTPPDKRPTTVVGDVMVRKREAVVLDRETSLEQAFNLLGNGSKRGVVVDGRRVKAIILASDLADVLLQLRDAARTGEAMASSHSTRPESGSARLPGR
jgi:Zn-dependent protease